MKASSYLRDYFLNSVCILLSNEIKIKVGFVLTPIYFFFSLADHCFFFCSIKLLLSLYNHWNSVEDALKNGFFLVVYSQKYRPFHLSIYYW